MNIKEMRLPRTGIGVHDGYEVSPGQWDAAIAAGMTITVTLDRDLDYLKALDDKGVVIVSRPWGIMEGQFHQNNDIHALRKWTTALLDKLGYAYIQLWNEISMSKNWKLFPDFAQTVIDRGGVPFIGALGATKHEEHWKLFDHIAERKGIDFMSRIGVITHHYDWGHPFEYPYDPINLAEHPSATLFGPTGEGTVADHQGPLGFFNMADLIDRWLDDNNKPGLKGTIPIIIGEGAPTIDPEMAGDSRYPFPGRAHHLKTWKGIHNLFKTGQFVIPGGLEKGRVLALPDNVLGYVNWLIADGRGRSFPECVSADWKCRKTWDSESWFATTPPFPAGFGAHRDHIVTPGAPKSVQWLTDNAGFVRPFSWSDGAEPAPAPPPSGGQMPDYIEATLTAIWKKRSESFPALQKAGDGAELGKLMGDEITVDGHKALLFTEGFAHALDGDWGNVKTVRLADHPKS